MALRGLRRAEVVHHLGRHLVGLGEQDPAWVLRVDHGPQPDQELMGGGEVLAVGALLLEQVGDRVQAEPVDAHVHPEPDDLEHRVLHRLVLEVEVGLVGEEAVPEELPAHRVEAPVGDLGVHEDDARVGIPVVGVGPDVEVPERPVRVRAGGLEPGVLVGGVVHHQVGDDAYAAGVRLGDQLLERRQGPELGQHRGVVGHVVAAVPQR